MWQLFSRPDWVDDIQRSLGAINRKVNQIMTTQAEFDTKVSAISSTLAVVASGVNATLRTPPTWRLRSPASRPSTSTPLASTRSSRREEDRARGRSRG